MPPGARSPWATTRFAESRVAHLATTRTDGSPHLVPIVFVLLPGHTDGAPDPLDPPDVLWSVVDGKPKSTTALRRLANIAAHPLVSLLVDHYTDDWSALWWVRADARAEVVEAGDGWHTGVAALVAKYDQYQQDPPTGPVIRAVVTRWSGWAYTQSA